MSGTCVFACVYASSPCDAAIDVPSSKICFGAGIHFDYNFKLLCTYLSPFLFLFTSILISFSSIMQSAFVLSFSKHIRFVLWFHCYGWVIVAAWSCANSCLIFKSHLKIKKFLFNPSESAAWQRLFFFVFCFFGGAGGQFITVVNSSEMGALLCFVIYRLTLMGLIQ